MTRRSLKKRQGGQIIVLMMLAAIPLASLVAFVLNGGELVTTKTRLQNAADTAALTEAGFLW